jgi:hypothetical protein
MVQLPCLLQSDDGVSCWGSDILDVEAMEGTLQNDVSEYIVCNLSKPFVAIQCYYKATVLSLCLSLSLSLSLSVSLSVSEVE